MSFTEAIKIAGSLFCGICFLTVIPAAIMKTIRRNPQWLTMMLLGMSLFSWCIVNAMWFIPAALGWRQPQGPEAALAIIFGWSYIWFAGTPYWLTAGIILWIRNWKNNRL